MLRRHLDDWERGGGALPRPRAAAGAAGLEATLKTSHLFNLLDARGAVSVTERVGLIARDPPPRRARGEGLPGTARGARAIPLGNALDAEAG